MNNNNCNQCPRSCHVNRKKSRGYCRSPQEITISSYGIHHGEEPCLAPKSLSGAIFFSYCPLRCIYCQNYQILSPKKTKTITINALANIMLLLEKKGAENIDLITPTHYALQIAEAIKIAKNKGLTIPIIYNSSGYENVETIKELNNLIDIYLPDLKYISSTLSLNYSNAKDYFIFASKAIEEMYNQVKRPVFNQKGQMIKGVLVRHLILPSHTEEAKKIIKYLYDKYHDNIYISIMNQYTPVSILPYKNLNRKLSKKEYEEVIDYAISIGIKNAFVQDKGSANKKYIPEFL